MFIRTVILKNCDLRLQALRKASGGARTKTDESLQISKRFCLQASPVAAAAAPAAAVHDDDDDDDDDDKDAFCTQNHHSVDISDHKQWPNFPSLKRCPP
ncbi:hypothetical protein PoB_003162000 [Plakobranchus ocellatus]|uniref:Uncharacterized protein n=1 Tax=Plakobranchus ocellatus TaxID=259542 RepID=A0AAV4AED7_9GAST|nr:hypothetical protein PoB_003162000 [Plakobranchus ocellatus]